jgi:ribosomal protein S10
LNNIIKEKNYIKITKNIKPRFFYSFHFSSIFYPGSLKNVNLFLRSSINREDNISSYRNGTYKNNKILLKQSYLLISWIHYLCKTPEDLNNTNLNKKLPSFFIHPYKQSKLTLIKSPLAHKTFSQEQFLNRYYKISVSFKPNFSDSVNSINSVNGSIYASICIRNNIPLISTNLLFLKKMSYSYTSNDIKYYSYYYFKKFQTNNVL